MPVYLIRDGEAGPVKIGWSLNPERRRGTFQTHHHSLLTILRLIDGPRRTERWMHHRFADRRLNREWFVFCEEMLTVQPDVPPPKAKTKRYVVPPHRICLFCESIKQPSANPACEDCDALFKRFEGLPDVERKQRFNEFFTAQRYKSRVVAAKAASLRRDPGCAA